jgi:hypothetical protein
MDTSYYEPIRIADDHEKELLQYVRNNLGWHGSSQDHEDIPDEVLLAAIRGTMEYMGVEVTTGEDGSWLHFDIEPTERKSVVDDGADISVNVCEHAKDFPHLEKWLKQWCDQQRRKQREVQEQLARDASDD